TACPIIFHITYFPFQKWIQFSAEHVEFRIPRWCFIVDPDPCLRRSGCPRQWKRLVDDQHCLVFSFGKVICYAAPHHTTANNNHIIVSTHHYYHPILEQTLQIWKQSMNPHLRLPKHLFLSVLKASSYVERLNEIMEYQSVHE